MPVVAIITTAFEAAPLIQWAARFARARNRKLFIFHPQQGARAEPPKQLFLGTPGDEEDDPTLKAIWDSAWAVAEHFAAPEPCFYGTAAATEIISESSIEGQSENSAAPAAEADVNPEFYHPHISIYSLRHPSPLAASLAQIKAWKADLLIVGRHEKIKGAARQEDLSLQLMARAPCDTMLLRASGESGVNCERILVPAAGGPHALVAMRLAADMSGRDQVCLEPLYIQPPVGEYALEVGMRFLRKSLNKAGVEPSAKIIPRVVLADSPAAGIAKSAEAGYDLVLVGASNQNFITRVLFGTISEKLLSGSEATAVAVLRKARPLFARTRDNLEAALDKFLPQLGRADRVSLFERLQTGSRVNPDFTVLICLSTAIACLGLLQNSAAVVIGAMLVAPLMTPMVGAGLSLVQGNSRLVRDAGRAILTGFMLALGIGYLTGLCGGWVMGGVGLTHELLARGSPNMLDLFVAFLSGLAAAYATARPNLLSALPGVAIAAALVPPIGTTGISFALGEYANGNGAALLFATNLVAIIIGSACAFWAVGIRGNREEGASRLWVKRMLLILFLALVVFAIPLAASLFTARKSVSQGVRVTLPLARAIEKRLRRIPGMTLVTIESVPGSEELKVLVASSSPPPKGLAADLAALGKQILGREVDIRLIAVRKEWQEVGR